MVARISSGKSIRGIMIYNEDKVEKGEANLLLASGFATDIDRLNFHQKLFRFEQLTMLNSRSKMNSMHISLNFHSDDKLDTEKLQQIASEYMERIGLGDQPFIAYEHFDAAHPHLHIATVLIDRHGERINTNNIGRDRSENARVLLEEKFGLVRAKGRKLGNEVYLKPAIYGEKPTKKQLANITRSVMRDYAYASFAEFKAVLTQFNVQVDRGYADSVMFEKKGLMYSIIGADGNVLGVPFKASAFYEGATMKRLEDRFAKNEQKRKAFRAGLKNKIDHVFAKYDSITRGTLLKELAREQVALVFSRNDNGLVYGVAFIDHGSKAVFKGSDVDKGYSAKGILERLADRDELKQYLARGRNDTYLEVDKEKGLGLGEKQVKEESLLDGLLEKADYDDPTVIGKKRKRRPGEEQSHGDGL